MPNTEDIIRDVTSKLTEYKDKLREGQYTDVVFKELSVNAKTLQDVLDNLLRKKDVLTNEDVNNAYETLQELKRQEFEKMSREANRKAIIYIGSVVVILSALYFLLKTKKSNAN